MQGPGSVSIGPFVLLLLAAGCSSASLPKLPPPQLSAQADQPDTSQPTVEQAVEHVSIVSGTPTEIYALVARGALRCWFGGDGPLKPTHVFHAEAESPAKGGAAEIIIHERDETLRDKRGARAFRVSLSSVPAGVRVAVSAPKMERQLAQWMVKDAEAWAKGGVDCEVRKHLAPQPITPVAGDGHGVKRR